MVYDMKPIVILRVVAESIKGKEKLL